MWLLLARLTLQVDSPSSVFIPFALQVDLLLQVGLPIVVHRDRAQPVFYGISCILRTLSRQDCASPSPSTTSAWMMRTAPNTPNSAKTGAFIYSFFLLSSFFLQLSRFFCPCNVQRSLIRACRSCRCQRHRRAQRKFRRLTHLSSEANTAPFCSIRLLKPFAHSLILRLTFCTFH